MNKCPICNQPVEAYHEVTFTKPFVHNIPFDGLQIYGAYAAPKEAICHENNFFHFAFYDSNGDLVQHRLVQLGVERPTTKSPSEEYMEGLVDEAEDEYPDEDDEDEDDPYSDEEYPHGSLDY